MRMKKAFESYFSHIFDILSPVVCALLVFGFIVAIVIGIQKGMKRTWDLLLLEYAILIMYVTVFSRAINARSTYIIQPFQSYKIIADGNPYLVPEVIMNVLMYVPLGALMRGVCSGFKWKKILLIGLTFSLLVELLQLILMRGTSEVDDLIHNTLGYMIGYWFCPVRIKYNNYV